MLGRGLGKGRGLKIGVVLKRGVNFEGGGFERAEFLDGRGSIT